MDKILVCNIFCYSIFKPSNWFLINALIKYYIVFQKAKIIDSLLSLLLLLLLFIYLTLWPNAITHYIQMCSLHFYYIHCSISVSNIIPASWSKKIPIHPRSLSWHLLLISSMVAGLTSNKNLDAHNSIEHSPSNTVDSNK